MRHGTLTAYVQHKCRCEACTEHHRRHQKRYRLNKLRGVVHFVDPEPVRRHVAELQSAGMSEWDITIAAGWRSRNSLHSVLRAKRIKPETAAKLLALKPRSDRRNRYVDATGSRRRLQALAVMGWPYRVIAERVPDMCKESIGGIQSGATTTTRQRIADAIAAVYDEMWDQPGPSSMSTNRALRKGWVPPLAWDDDAIDDPAALPHSSATTARNRMDDLIEDVTELRSQGVIFSTIAARLGMSEMALDRSLRRAGRPDLVRASA